MHSRAWLLVLLATLLALGIRLYRLDDVPPGLFRDEATAGANAWSLALTGRDLHGAEHPVIFRMLDDWSPPLDIYAAAASMRVLGPTKLAVRLPMAIAGTLTVLLLALLSLELGRDRRAAIASALVLAVTPWHVQYSRMAWRSATLGFTFVLALWLYFRARRLGGAWRHALAGAAFALPYYSYAPAKLLVPAFLSALFLIENRDARWIRAVGRLVTRKTETAPPPVVAAASEPAPPAVASPRDAALLVLAFVVALVTVSVPMAVAQFEHWDEIQTRFRAISVSNSETPVLEACRSYAAHLSPRFLFLEGDQNPRHGLPGFGGLLLVTAPFCALGLLRALARREAGDLLVLLWLAIYPLGAALTMEGIPHASRSFLAVPLFALLAGDGLSLVLDRLELARSRVAVAAVALGLLAANAGLALRSYFVVYPAARSVVLAWDGGVEELVRSLEARRGTLRRVMFARGLEPRVMRDHVVFWKAAAGLPFDSSPDPYYEWSQEDDLARALAALRDDEALVARPERLPGVSPSWTVSDPMGAVVFGVYRGAAK